MLFWRGGERHPQVVRTRFTGTAASPWMGAIMYSTNQRMYSNMAPPRASEQLIIVA